MFPISAIDHFTGDPCVKLYSALLSPCLADMLRCEAIPRNHLCWTRVPLVSCDLFKIEPVNGKKPANPGYPRHFGTLGFL